MIKMIISAPAGVKADKILDVTTAIIRLRNSDTYGAYSEFSLGDYADGNTIDANLIDFNALDAIAELQAICPVEIHFEARAGKSPFDGDVYDEELFDDALDALYCNNERRI